VGGRRSSVLTRAPRAGDHRRADAALDGHLAVPAHAADGRVPHDVKEYPEAGHSFMNATRDGSRTSNAFRG
jgi:hypothetical protein